MSILDYVEVQSAAARLGRAPLHCPDCKGTGTDRSTESAERAPEPCPRCLGQRFLWYVTGDPEAPLWNDQEVVEALPTEAPECRPFSPNSPYIGGPFGSR